MSGENAGIQHSEGAAGTSERCELRVGGMDCPSCADHVKKALDQLEGVQDVQVDVMGGKVQVSYAAGKLARGDLAAAIRRIGYEVGDDEENRRVTFVVEGMDCADEVRQIEGALSKLPGVTDLQFNLLNHQLTVEGSIAQDDGHHVDRSGFPRVVPRTILIFQTCPTLAQSGNTAAVPLPSDFPRGRLAECPSPPLPSLSLLPRCSIPASVTPERPDILP